MATIVNGAGVEVEGVVVAAFSSVFGTAVSGGVFDSASSSGMVGQYVLRTCLSAGRRMGFERKKFMPESRHSCMVISIQVRILST